MAQILVVDDDMDVLRLLSRILEQDGYTVVTAHDGAEAVQFALQAPPDCLILDVVLPVMNGYEVARHLRNDPRTAAVPIIALSGLGSFDEVRAITAGCDGFVPKPFDIDNLLALIATLTQRRRSRASGGNDVPRCGTDNHC